MTRGVKNETSDTTMQFHRLVAQVKPVVRVPRKREDGVMASTNRSMARITKRPMPLYKQLAELSLMFIVLVMTLALSAVLAMEFTLGVF
ncbi:hypothetical protein VC35_12915 [Pseudomonas fluorescens]|uniref:Transmembrane protein n=1 Tax=Pseudomonas fluorescens TaxID=294 RepID=A0A0F4TP97_PSEFL|nr:hypothetical protein VC35_12915 [Pseudomonas fluorescens]